MLAARFRSRPHSPTQSRPLAAGPQYRVVDAGQSPRSEAISVLSAAMSLIERHGTTLYGRSSYPALAAGAAVSVAAAEAKIATEQSGVIAAFDEIAWPAAARESWSGEWAECLFGLGVTRLIHRATADGATDASHVAQEEAEIEALLTSSLQLRRGLGLHTEVGDTLNSLGTLKQRQRAFNEAEAHYEESLRLRTALADEISSQSHPPQAADEKARAAAAQAIAQSRTSLGTLAIERGDAAAAEAKALMTAASSGKGGEVANGSSVEAAASLRDAAAAHYEAAHAHMQAAKEAYVTGFHASHPKVAWAIEGLGTVCEKRGDFEGALKAYKAAAEVRRSLQYGSGDKQLFHKVSVASLCPPVSPHPPVSPPSPLVRGEPSWWAQHPTP